MNTAFLDSIMQEALYTRKEGTGGSYYWQSGSRILPNRLSISRNREMTQVARNGRNSLHPIAGQLLGKFTTKETSVLKRFKPYECRTQIWQVPEYPQFIGYGTIGISNAHGKVDRNSDTGDLVIFQADNILWGKITVWYFPKMEMHLFEVLAYLSKKLSR